MRSVVTVTRVLIYGSIFAVVVLLWWSLTGVFGDAVFEGHSQSYAEYRKNDQLPVLDPVGATDISHKTVSDSDTSDRWLVFTMSRSDFESLVEDLGTTEHCQAPLPWETGESLPPNWQPRHNPPSWWLDGNVIPNSMDIHWCYPSEASMHHGWYFRHEENTNRVFCWHWRYQWAGDMCS